MKTKKKREKDSRKRQMLAQQLAGWKQKIAELQIYQRAGGPGAAEKIEFCQEEMTKIHKALKKTWTPQRAWAAQGFRRTMV